MSNVTAAGPVSIAIAAARTLLARSATFCELLSEKVVNGIFDTDSDWTKGLGWAIDAVTTKKAIYTHNVGFGNLTPETPLTITADKFYLVSFAISGWTGTVAMTAFLGGTTVKAVTGNGSYSEIVAATDTTSLIFDVISSAAGAIFVLDDVSVKEIPIHIGAYRPDDPESDWDRPFAVISRNGQTSRRRIGTGTAVDSGELRILFEKEISADYRTDDQQRNAQLEFENWVGQIIDECMVLAGTAGYLLVRSMEIVDGPFRYENEPIQNVMGCWVSLRYGLDV